MDNEPESFRNAVQALNKPQREQLDARLACVVNRWDTLKNNGGGIAWDELCGFFDWAREELADAYWDMFEQRFLNGEKGHRTPGGCDKAEQADVDDVKPDVPYVDNHLNEPKRIPFYRTCLMAISSIVDKALEEGDKHE